METNNRRDKVNRRRNLAAKKQLVALRQQIEATDNGQVRAPGLGVFIVRTMTKEAEGRSITRRRVILRMGGKARAKGDLTPTTPTTPPTPPPPPYPPLPPAYPPGES